MTQYSGLVEFIERYNEVRGDSGAVEYKTNYRMSDMTSFKLGGKADIVIFPSSLEAFRAILKWLSENNMKYMVLGKGSNVLFSDEGYRGAVVSVYRLAKIAVDDTESIVEAECGAPLTSCAVSAQRASLTGLEFAYGIPGSCGGAVFMNAGAYGGEMAGVVEAVTYYDTYSDSVRTIFSEECDFRYRHSLFRDNPNMIILSIKLRLSKGDKDEIKRVMDDYMNRRISKQPLEYPSAGSVFKRYPGYYTAQLIDEAGLKGVSVGGAQVSEKHAGFIINKGNATEKDVISLIELIQKKVKEINGIDIECEIIKVK